MASAAIVWPALIAPEALGHLRRIALIGEALGDGSVQRMVARVTEHPHYVVTAPHSWGERRRIRR
jgi:hypothetical protein